MSLLDDGDFWKFRFDGLGDIAFDEHAVKAALIRVERENGFGSIWLGRLLPECHYDSIRKDGQRSEGEGHVIQIFPMILADDGSQIDMAASPNRKVDDP